MRRWARDAYFRSGGGCGKEGWKRNGRGEYRQQACGSRQANEMFLKVLRVFSCTRSYYSCLGYINSFEPAIAALTNEQLKGMTGVRLGKCGARGRL